MTLQKDDTVLSELLRTVEKKNVSYTGSNGTAFITALYGIANSKFSTAGWIYLINGTRPDKSCGISTVKNGDKVEWVYSTNGY